MNKVIFAVAELLSHNEMVGILFVTMTEASSLSLSLSLLPGCIVGARVNWFHYVFLLLGMGIRSLWFVCTKFNFIGKSCIIRRRSPYLSLLSLQSASRWIACCGVKNATICVHYQFSFLSRAAIGHLLLLPDAGAFSVWWGVNYFCCEMSIQIDCRRSIGLHKTISRDCFLRTINCINRLGSCPRIDTAIQ